MSAVEGAPASIDLRQSVIDAFDKIALGGVIAKAIEDAVTKTVTGLVNEALGKTYNSPFADAVKAAIEKSLAFDAENLGLPSYNDLMLKVIQRQVNTAIGSTIGKQVAGQVASLLQDAPQTFSLRRLVEDFRGWCERLHSNGTMEFSVEESDLACLAGHHTIRLAPGGDRYGGRRSGLSIGTDKEGAIRHLWIEGKSVEDRLFVGELSGFERQIFQLYTAKSRIVFDVEPYAIELEYGEHCHC